MLLVVGPSSDSTTRYVARAVDERGLQFTWIDLDEAVDGRWWIEVGGRATVRAGAAFAVAEPGDAVYARLIPPWHADAGRGLALATGFAAWLEVTTGRVVNRPGHAIDNGSKPLHEWWLHEQGFDVPPSITSASREELLAFARAEGRVVVKTIAGVRADCRLVTEAELDAFEPEQGPIHLQAAIDGFDVRAHVVADVVLAVAIRTSTVDYRIADDSEYVAFDVPPEVSTRMVGATAAAGLVFAGWDFKVDADGRWHALEANPMPGYHIYDRVLDGAVTDALLGYLLDAA